MAGAFQISEDGEPSDDRVALWQEFAEGLDWYSDYDCGVAINSGDPERDMLRADPGDWVVRWSEGKVEVYSSVHFDTVIRPTFQGDVY